ncbi:hypothetical protein KUCAC02_004971, partial [Chaenocephalus aceratus]
TTLELRDWEPGGPPALPPSRLTHQLCDLWKSCLDKGIRCRINEERRWAMHSLNDEIYRILVFIYQYNPLSLSP